MPDYGLIRLYREEFRGYDASKFQQDLLAGLTVAAVALPLALAFGVASGATAAAGLITAILAGVVIGLLSGAPYQISGPTGAMSAVLIVLAQRYGLEGVFISGLLSGVLLFLIGVLRLGRFIAFIPSPVIAGFTSGIALIIFIGQIDPFLGVQTAASDSAAWKLIGYFKGGYIPDGRTVLLGGVVVLTMLVTPKKVSTRFPSSLLGLILATFINWAAGWSVASIGQIPQTLWLSERLSFVSLASHDWTDFVAPALTIAALGAIESLLCGAVASNMTGIRLQANQELIGQGVGNILIPFFGGVPATAAIARTSVGIKSGGHTRMVSLVHAVGLLLSMFLLAPVMARIPLAALAGVLMVTAVRMNEWYAIRFLFGKRFKTGMATYALTLLATVALDLTQAILIGTLVSAAVFLNQLSSLDIHIQEIIPEKLRQRGIQAVGDCAHVRVAFITGPLFFAATDKFNEAFKELNEMHALILSMRGVSNIDVSGLEAMRDLLHRLRKQGGTLMISGIHENARKTLERGGFLDDVGQDNIFWSSDQAIVEAERRGCLYCQAGAKPDGDGTAGLGEMNITS